MRVAIYKNEGYLDGMIQRILQQNNIKGDIINKFTRSSLLHHDVVIFTYNNPIPNKPKVIEQIVLEQKVHVIYICNTGMIGPFYNVMSDPYFSFIEERKIEFLLPFSIQNNHKFYKLMVHLTEEAKHAKEELSLQKLTNKAKRILMNKGFSEEKSHKFIIEKSMEMRIPKKKLVNLIIENKIDF